MRIVTDETPLSIALVEAGFLDPNRADDPNALTAATTRMIEVFATEKTT